ncbi:hypothetical protein DL89DRAFT_264245 [Linderina pennispora]|uniref:Uncharacterized protein n=1 Tax=Linderina pennispora TaxID=61395 RepID=A0A1Y1WL99_9FUNG|nr:uncharacterized protein DL89DRAFT_264245 [Linderina pennispora]ORX74341.1 hypothetical protein DL89DRAFT_264245 [Linderina pennispora]
MRLLNLAAIALFSVGHASVPATIDTHDPARRLKCRATADTQGLAARFWARTSDSCYIPSYYMQLSANATEIVSCDTLRNSTATRDSLIRPRADISGRPTIGYGHRCESLTCEEVPVEFPMSRSQAQGLLRFDLGLSTQCLSEAIDDSVVLNENQWAALTSWAFDSPGKVASGELPKWIRYRGKTTYSLQYRRYDEMALFNTPSGKQAHPLCVL